jgi:hypothetical protein
MQPFFTSSRNRSILLLIFSGLSILVLLTRGIYLLIDGLLGFINQEFTWIDLGPSMMDAGSMLVCACLLIPLLVGCIRQLQQKPLPVVTVPPIKNRSIWLFLPAWVFLVALASLLTAFFDFGWLPSLPFFLLAVLLPVLVFSWIAVGGLFSGSRRRLWASLGLGMTGGTSLALILEYSLVALAVGIGAVVVVFQPTLMEPLKDIQSQVQAATKMEDLLIVLAPYLTQPWVFLLVLLFAAVLGPMVEEAVKPLAVWILGRHLRTPGEGFALGALSGAGFALLEGLMAASGMASVPYFAIPARLTSSLMHITLSGIVGWGIYSALKEKRWKRLLAAYSLSSLLHGLWNGSALLAVFGALRFEIQGMQELDALGSLAILLGIFTLGVVFVLILVALPLLNRRFRSLQGDIIAPLASQVERTSDGLDSPGN